MICIYNKFVLITKLILLQFIRKIYIMIEDLSGYLIKNNIKPSFQRIKVMEYLAKKQNHPTVDEIYSELVKEIPTLSRTTIYNTLNIFKKANLVNSVTIEDDKIRYDYVISAHGHFKCNRCKEIYDFSINIDNMEIHGLEQFKINEKNVYFNGVCLNCLEYKNKI